MTEVIPIPPVVITMGQPFELMFRLEDPTDTEVVLPLTDREVSWALAETIDADPFLSGVGSIITDAIGDHVHVEITGAQTAGLAAYALPIVRGRPCAVLQIRLTAPTPANTLHLQGQATIQRTL